MKSSLSHLIAVTILSSAIALTASSQTALPAALDGSMMTYDFAAVDSSAGIPDSLRVIKICYIARHGARYLSSPSKIDKVGRVLRDQDSAGTITQAGRMMLRAVKAVDSVTAGRWGALSDVGIAEEQLLARQMSQLVPDLLRQGRVEARATYVPRVVMSMYEFLHTLGAEHSHLDISTLAGRCNDSLLRCFDTFRVYSEYRDDGSWMSVYDDYVNRYVPSAPAQRILGATGSPSDVRHLTMDIYSILQGLRASGLPAPTDALMSVDEYRACYRTANLQRYLRNTLNPQSVACAGATAMLIRDIIQAADSATADSVATVPLTAWFGHAETLMPMLSVMEVPGCCYFTDDYTSVSHHWQSQDIVPLAANLAILIMQPVGSATGDTYAAIRLNGRNIAPWAGAPRIVHWSDLRAHWLSRIARFSNLNPTAL